ncbi:MAG: DNA repair protein RecO [Planctomycetaceae bacterium]|nr:DNA repair protein RecO [Planctomycetaceae bacterium]
MSLEKTDALVIRLADWSESSRVVTLFTRDFGKISALAKGAKRLRSSFEAALDLLSESRIVFLRKSSSSLDILTESQLISRFQPSAKSLISLYGGYYVAELLSGLCEPEDPHPRLYEAARQTLRRLESETDARSVILRFELVLLREIGHLPDFDACLVCGAPVSGGRQFAFWVSQGGLICTTCQRPDLEQTQINAGSIAWLRTFLDDDPAVARHVVASEDQLSQLRHITTAAVTHVLERRPSTLRYLNFD